jgi:hypothetical protein
LKKNGPGDVFFEEKRSRWRFLQRKTVPVTFSSKKNGPGGVSFEEKRTR